ncbi:uncharacterized protein [Palaemon carinicauda]|uniref:uncharacterized protein n=1 Tax=Palaemon carinicauda TaxID=392227 RepID=UPI0035B61A5C
MVAERDFEGFKCMQEEPVDNEIVSLGRGVICTLFPFFLYSIDFNTIIVIYINILYLLTSSAVFMLFQASTIYATLRISKQIDDITWHTSHTDQQPIAQKMWSDKSMSTRKLLDLQREVHSVDCVLRNVVGFFSPFVSLCIFGCSITTITSCYKFFTTKGQIEYASGILIFFGFMFIPCHTGQVFTNQMQQSSFDLRSGLSSITNFEDRVHVQHLASRLNEMSRIDINGCFTLGYHTLISIGSFIATYVVVLLQVGPDEVDKHIGFITPANVTNA